MGKQEYGFEFEGQRYVVDGTDDDAPNYIVLPDMMVVRVVSLLETHPAQIDEVEFVRSLTARKA